MSNGGVHKLISTNLLATINELFIKWHETRGGMQIIYAFHFFVYLTSILCFIFKQIIHFALQNTTNLCYSCLPASKNRKHQEQRLQQSSNFGWRVPRNHVVFKNSKCYIVMLLHTILKTNQRRLCSGCIMHV